MSDHASRRQFLGTAGAAALTAAAYGRVLGAADRLAVGVVGTGRRGRALIRAFRTDKDVEVRAVCDVYAAHLEQGAREAGGKPRAVTDYRAVLDDKDVKAVVIATPDH